MYLISGSVGRGSSGGIVLFFILAYLLLSGCEADSGSSGSSSAAVRSAPSKPELAVRSDYYSAEVEADLRAAGLSSQVFRQGQRHYELYCTNCHAAPKSASSPVPKTLLGPPSYAVAAAYRQAYPNARERSTAMARFTAKPSEDATLMPSAVERYGLMAPMPLSESQLEAISIFLATAEFVKPDWYEEPAVE